MVACWRYSVSTVSHASLPSVSVFNQPVCTYCSRVFVVALPLTSTLGRALLQVHLSSSSVQTTWDSHCVSRKIADVSNPAARDRTVPHREQGRGSLRPDIFQQNPFFSLERSVAPHGTLAASVVSPPLRHRMAKLLGHSRGFSTGSTRRDRMSMTAPEKEAVSFVSPGFGADHHGPTPAAEDSHVRVPVVASKSWRFQMLVCPLAFLIFPCFSCSLLISRIFPFPGLGRIGVRELLTTLMSLSKLPRHFDEAIKNFLDSLMSHQTLTAQLIQFLFSTWTSPVSLWSGLARGPSQDPS